MCGRRPYCNVSGLLVRREPLALMCSADRVLISFAALWLKDPGQVYPAMIKEAQGEEATLIEKARLEAADTLSNIKTRIAGEVAAAKGLLQEQAASLSCEICEKVLGRSLHE